jgi:gliding motility-associated-like protein
LPGSYTATINHADISCPQTAVPVVLRFDAPPTLSVEKLGDTPFCDGQTIDLKATYNTGSLRWSTGETTNTIGVKTSGTYTAFVKTAAGCEVKQPYQLQLFNKPTLNVPDAKLCQFNKESVTLTAPPGFAKYEWNGAQGTNTFVTGVLGAVTLNVTDANGCTASQTINVTSYCLEIKFPNTFTPNGDGINDTWVIAGLEGDPTSRVQIFNRNGTMILDSKTYPVPWDGKYHGKKVNAGVYYYIITAKNGKQVMNGALTIIY